MTNNNNRFALYLLMFNLFITMGGVGLIVPIMPAFLETFGVGGSVLGFLIALFSFGQFLFSPIAGDLSDRYGRKVFIIGGLILYSLSSILVGTANELWLLFVGRFLTGVGAAFIMPTIMAYIADITTVKDRGRGMSLAGASISFGFMIGPALGGFLSKISVSFPFILAGIIAIVAAVITIVFLPKVEKKEQVTVKKRDNLLKQLVQSVKTPYFVILIIIFTFSFGIANFQSTLAFYLYEKFTYSSEDISIILAIGGFTGVLLQMFVVDKLFNLFGEMKVVLASLVVAAISILLVIFVSGFFWITLVATIFGTATTFIRPAVNTLVSKMAGKEQGYAAGMNNAYMSLGNMIGPAIAGILFDWKMDSPYIVGCLILITCLTVALVWSRLKEPSLLQAR